MGWRFLTGSSRDVVVAVGSWLLASWRNFAVPGKPRKWDVKGSNTKTTDMNLSSNKASIAISHTSLNPQRSTSLHRIVAALTATVLTRKIGFYSCPEREAKPRTVVSC